MFKKSIVSYPDRGQYGDNKYRGNTSGLIVKDFLEFVHKDRKKLFVDPAEGGKTSRDVAEELQIRYRGLDLSSGFNLLKDDLGMVLKEKAHTCFFHPPYHQMIQYSGNVWGTERHPDDLSNCKDINDFIVKLQLALMNIYDALENNGHYAVLMANWRKKGVYYPLCSILQSICPGRMREEIIKEQNNVSSSSKVYANNNFVPISHEILYIYQKTASQFSLDYSIDLSMRVKRLFSGTWKNLIKRVLMRAGTPLRLNDIYQQIEGTEKAKNNPHWTAKVRQVLSQDKDNFKAVEKGVYTLA